MSEFYHETPVKKTRKPKRCRWCSYWIEKGDSCVVASGVWEGDFFTERFHPECSPRTLGFGGEFPYDRMVRGELKSAE